ncbi:MAG: PP2C family protein-serine/threonine phosphatase [Acidobacteriota bacterium]
MADISELREQLIDRRSRLETAASRVDSADDLVGLIRSVDEALHRLEAGSFGSCLACRETVDEQALLDAPLLEYCLCHLTSEQQEALQRDLDLASKTQRALLPKQDLTASGWRVHYRYIPAGPVSGDYCDFWVPGGDSGPLFFILGDVSGKGVAASFLMARLHSMFRTLVDTGSPLQDLVARANRLFGENKVPAQYATLVCGRAEADGRVAICNAGHPPPMIATKEEVRSVEATGLPVGLFTTGPYSVYRTTLSVGDSLLLFTDGLTETRDATGHEFGRDRVLSVLRARSDDPPEVLASAYLGEVKKFSGGGGAADDLTLMVVRRHTD